MAFSAPNLISIFADNVEFKAKKVALRHKYLGVWREWTWLDLAHSVQQYLAFFEELNTKKSDRILIYSTPHLHFFAVTIAAHVLELQIQLVEKIESQQLADHIQLIPTDLVFIDDLKHLDAVDPQQMKTTILYLNDTRLTQQAFLKQYAVQQRLQTHQVSPFDLNHLRVLQHNISEQQTAFLFYKAQSTQYLQLRYSHHDLLQEAQHLIDTHLLDHTEQAFISRSFTSHEHIRYLFATWLLAGFCLNIPEHVDTRDHDRQLIAPTLLLGHALTYQRLKQQIQPQLPQAQAWLYKLAPHLNHWRTACISREQPPSNLLQKWIEAMFKRAILAALGLSHLKTALLIGAPVAEQTAQFYQHLGITLSQWESVSHWQPVADSLTADSPELEPISSAPYGDSYVIGSNI